MTDLIAPTPAAAISLYREIEERLQAKAPAPLILTHARLPEHIRLPDVVIETSGSTKGRPELVGLSWKALRSSAEATWDYLQEPGQWWLRLPINKIAGFQVLVRSAIAGIPPSLTPAGSSYTAVVPTQVRRDPDILRTMKAVLVGGAPSPGLPDNIPFIRTYGMTETCGGCVYDGVPLSGTQVRIDDGKILLAGPMLMEGYLGSQSPFIEDGNTRWLETGDIGTFDQGRLTVLGRADDIIISGGVNIVPSLIKSVILQKYPDLEVEVMGVPDPEWGEAVCAVVVGHHGGEEIVLPLEGHMRPRIVVHLPQMPLLSNGKIDKAALRHAVDERIRAGRAWRR